MSVRCKRIVMRAIADDAFRPPQLHGMLRVTAGWDEPTLPETWKQAGYRFWQRSSQYAIPGTSSGPVDDDLFSGTRADLYC